MRSEGVEVIDADEDARLAAIAASLSAADERFDADRQAYAEQLPDELPGEDALTLHVDDFSIISNLKDIRAIEGYPARAFVRARDGDLVAGTFPPIPGYTDYLSGHLGLGTPTYIRANPAPGAPVYAGFAALLGDEEAQRKIEDKVRDVDRDFWFHPYMGLEAAWRFARRMTDRCGRPARVLGPLPTITERANNKLWFTEVVTAVLGSESALDSRAARSPGEVCDRLVATARLVDGDASGARVVLKLSDSASGMGTSIFEPDAILARSPESLRAFVDDWLDAHEWSPQAPPLSIERWESPVLGSPSIQLWIPPLPVGADPAGAAPSTPQPSGAAPAAAEPSGAAPILEGVFDQIFYPDNETVFLGGVPTHLPDPIVDRIGEAGVRIGRVFQRLGYVGRCSFDTILVGDDLTNATIKFNECNGRWGGTSTPMSLMNRLFGDYREQPYSCRNFSAGNLKGVRFDELRAKLGSVLYDARSGDGWAILFNLGCLEPAGKFDLITLGETFEEADGRQGDFGELATRLFHS